MNDFKNFKAKLDEKNGLWDNIHAKRKRGEKPNPPGHPDRPTAQDFKDAQKKESVEEKKTANEAKDGDGANIVRDREFKGKKLSSQPRAKPGDKGFNSYDKLFKKGGQKPAWMDREKMKKESLDISEISLDMLTKKISNSGMDTTKKANKMDKTKNDLAAMKARLSGKPALAKEAKEDDEPASPDEASMALKQLEFIEYAAEEMMDHIKSGKEFPEWFQNKLSKAHGEIEGLHSSMGEHGEDEEDMKEAVRRKGAPKMKGDSIAIQRAKDAELNKALDRTKTGRKKPVRQMTSTQRSLAQLRREETELDEGISNNMRLISKIKNSGVVKSGSMSKDTKPAPKKEGINTDDRKPEKFIKPDGKIGIRMVPMDKNVVDTDK